MVNHVQLVGRQDGTVLVPTYNWAEFFVSPFRQKALKGIKAMHHLTFTDAKPGVVKDSVNSPEREISLIKDSSWKPKAGNLPPVIPPPGLSLERRQYVFGNFVLTVKILCAQIQHKNLPHLLHQRDIGPNRFYFLYHVLFTLCSLVC